MDNFARPCKRTRSSSDDRRSIRYTDTDGLFKRRFFRTITPADCSGNGPLSRRKCIDADHSQDEPMEKGHVEY